MNPILTSIDFIARSSGGVALLRKLVLELAVRGKLVSQDPKEEPASVLIERIKREKTRLVKEGRIKAGKELPEIKEEEKPYELPKGWEWVRLGNIVTINPRNKIDDSLDVSFIPMAMIPDTVFSTHSQEIRKWAAVKNGFTHFSNGDICLAKITPCYENGKGCVLKDLKNDYGAGTTELHILRPFVKGSFSLYIHIFIKTPSFIDGGIQKMTGTAGQKRLPKDYIENKAFPLPPYSEQSRIVARVQELMAVLDHLEGQTNKTEEERNRALIAATQALSQAAAPEEITSSWLRLATDLDRLVDRTEDVKTIRAMILELAVRGKLVSQDPKDEPAFVLLERINREKTRLAKERKIKAGKQRPEIKEEEKPYELPSGWEWVKFGQIIELISGQHLLPSEYNQKEKGFPYYTGPADFGIRNPTPSRWTITDRAVATKNDILLTVKGAGVGKINILGDPVAAISRQLMAIRPIICTTEYLYLILSSKLSSLKSLSIGIAIPGISREDVCELATSLPPLSEQSRILTRLQELMAILDRLEEKLAARDKVAVLASESIVKMNQV